MAFYVAEHQDSGCNSVLGCPCHNNPEFVYEDGRQEVAKDIIAALQNERERGNQATGQTSLTAHKCKYK